MILCFNCLQETKRLLDELLHSGGYRDYGDVITTAIANLSMLQGEIARTGPIIIGDTEQQTGAPPAPSVIAPTRETTPVIAPPIVPTQLLPARLLRKGIGTPPVPPSPLPDDVWTSGAPVPLDRWVFGQYNKLLPAKVSCRALAHLLTAEPRGVILDDAARQIAADAKTFGVLLRQYDEQHQTDRDAALAVAFPAGDEDKAVTRYANQFVANVNKFGQVSGLLLDLKLINYTKTKDVRLLLTSVGWQFASLHNPVLDAFPPTTLQKFSDQEVTLLLGHVATAVPAEDFAYRTIIAGITAGAATPDQIDEHLQQFVSADRQEQLSKSFLASQRSGAISRMVDLGLLRRSREGVRVSYMVTARGQEYAAGNARKEQIAKCR